MKHKKFLAILLSILALTFLSVGCSIDSEEEASILEVSELSVELGLYEEHTITAANPAGELSWKSSDETVVTVDGGVLYAVGAGTAKITVNDGVFTAFIDVTVTDDGTVPVLTAPEALSVEYGKTVTITPTYTFKGEAAENVTYTYESGDEEIVTVDENGVVTGVKQGEATVTVKANWKTAEELTKEVKITVEDIDFGYIFANGKLSGGKATLVYATEESGTFAIGAIYATVDGVATTDELEMIWTSENEDVITVNNGVIEAVAVGTATVRGRAFYADQERVITLAVTVEKGITLTAEESVMEFDSVTLTANTKADGTVVWTSSDETVATVDENGVVTGVKPGTVNITARLGKDSAICVVTVTKTNVPHVIVLDKEALELVYGEKGTVTPSITFKGETLTGYDVQYVWALESGTDVADIDGNEFTAKAVGEGVYKLTATVRGKTAEKELTVTVTKKVEEIATEYTLEVAGSRKATAMTMPEGINAADVEKLTVNGEVVYTKGEVNGQNVPVTNLPVAVEKLGEGKEVRIETASVIYLAKANLYTMIITTADELDAWQETASEQAIAAGLINANQKGATMSGYFVLCND
ncbi:MAG: Ig-like domain-containing protein, partial [Clostridia bacterium]|nr:Ig-like domain-containing protein [Clostridia bacterium]